MRSRSVWPEHSCSRSARLACGERLPCLVDADPESQQATLPSTAAKVPELRMSESHGRPGLGCGAVAQMDDAALMAARRSPLLQREENFKLPPGVILEVRLFD